MAAYTRENIPEPCRKDFTLLVDEFHNFSCSDLCNSFAEARKYHLRLVLANQNIAQLDNQKRENLLGNVGNLISFRLGSADANYIEQYLQGVFRAKDLVGLPYFTAIANILAENRPVKPFVFRTSIYK